MIYQHSDMPRKMTKIERLMAALECGPTPGGRMGENPDDAATMRDARQLILDLLGMSDLPLGERIYRRACERMAAEVGENGAGDLEGMIRLSERWLPEIWPASDTGQVHFGRAMVEALIAAGKAHLKRTAGPTAG